jgi:Domain of unknown function (DUF3783)
MSQAEFRRIDQDEGGPLGPDAVLLCGYSIEESRGISSLLGRIEASGHRVILCTEAMLGQTLAEALGTADEALPVPPDKLPRVIVLSGMTGEQVRALLDQYSALKLPRPIFATVTPTNRSFTVRDLLVDLLKEHRAVKAKK